MSVPATHLDGCDPSPANVEKILAHLADKGITADAIRLDASKRTADVITKPSSLYVPAGKTSGSTPLLSMLLLDTLSDGGLKELGLPVLSYQVRTLVQAKLTPMRETV